ncbi:TIGR00180 family glycosyltransferase [uncultured Paraglaciecola sp.]|uniref:TIGR00180 family glycosyltransferase n=1 Tax=uncultured Paraglaciecola sp. TaxID=1765024 RepID=UPI00261B968C|nr:TIGR00180 family glycosyltransferase [uncultured Paraglaciecola sp.]
MIEKCQSVTDLSKLFTIVTLSWERKALLRRYFVACEHNGFDSIVVDGSRSKYTNDIPANVRYFHAPDKGAFERLSFGLDKVKTPYTLFLADDDFIVPSALLKAVRFLQENPDYHSIQGKVLTINELYTKSDIRLRSYKGFEAAIALDAPQAEQRLINHMQEYVFTIYSLQKTSVWKCCIDKIYEGLKHHPVTTCLSPAIFELTQSIHCILSGKNKTLDEVFLIRESVPRPEAEKAEGHLYFNESLEFDAYTTDFVQLLNDNLNLIDIDLPPLLSNAFAVFAEKRRGNSTECKFNEYGQISRMVEIFSSQHSELQFIADIIKIHREDVVSMLLDNSEPHLEYWYDDNWVNDIALKYQQIAFELPHYVLYGAGEHTQKLLDKMGKIGKLMGVIDKNSWLWGTRIENVKCHAPDCILSLSTNIIISSQEHENAIELELKKCFNDHVNIYKLYS